MNNFFLRTIIVVFMVATTNIVAQRSSDLFINKAFKNALKTNTRSLSGMPGSAYWQNRVDYKIKASFNVETRTVDGFEEITYSNNSPDTLKQLYFDLIQDLFKKGSSRDWDLGKVDLHDGVIIKELRVDGEDYDVASIYRNSSKMVVRLNKHFAPMSKHKIEIAWEVILPGTRTVRMGTYNKTNFMVAYWFPKLAVYDDLWGWARQPHTGNCEYYNEFGDYEVEIMAPKGFSVWSTGVLQNANEVFQKKIISRLNKAAQSQDVVHITTVKDIENNKVLLEGDSLLWKFKIESVPDFAFAMSKSYIWDATSIQSGNKRVMVNAVYKSSSSDFHTVANVAQKSIRFFTNESPKIPFPYPQITIFNGAGGMEFPGMVNDGDSRSYTGTLFVTSHEIGHSYYPFNTGLNEQLYAWMDEGLITFFPRKVVAKYTDDSAYTVFEDIIRSYNRHAGSIREIPLMIPSTNTGFSYRYQAYSRSSVAFYTLCEYLGVDTFDMSLQEFSRRWEHKHPTPYDFFNTFNEVAGEDLAWFWDPWFFELGYADLALEVTNNKRFAIVNKGGFPVPIHLTITFKNGRIEKMDIPASVWKNGRKTFEVSFIDKDYTFVKLSLDTKLTPDAFVEDNVWIEKE
ncbi:MAG: M1 family metallopeptidase [Bacteroidales bacterium]|nr:M1 family metallopeptidase [Bacteroidales bacterium]